MRRKLHICIIMCLIIAAGLSSVIQASPAVLTVTASVNNATKLVTISGTVSTGAGVQVSVRVTNPSGSIDYIEQAESGTGGSFQFRYTLDEDESGTYSVSVGGTGISAPAAVAFTYTAGSQVPSDHQGGPSNGPNHGTDNGANHDQQVVNEVSLRPGKDNKVSIYIAQGKKEVLLPSNAADLIGGKKLEINGENVSVTIDSEVLQALAGLAGTEASDGGHISLRMNPAPDGAIINTPGYAMVKSAGQAYSFDLLLVMKDGKERKLSAFGKPVEVSLSYRAGADEDLLGVYYYNEQSQAWEYVGGKVDKAGNKIMVMLPHFSTYAVLAYDKTFADLPGSHWAYQAVKVLSAKHVVAGVSETEFAPDNAVTRAEFAALLARSLGLQAKSAAPFGDIQASAWYADEIAAAYEAKLINGRTDSVFAPSDKITREEMAAMIIRAYEFATGEVPGGNSAALSDRESVSGWAVKYVDAAVNNGLMKGIGGNRFAPEAISSRAESAQTIFNLLTTAE